MSLPHRFHAWVWLGDEKPEAQPRKRSIGVHGTDNGVLMYAKKKKKKKKKKKNYSNKKNMRISKKEFPLGQSGKKPN